MVVVKSDGGHSEPTGSIYGSSVDDVKHDRYHVIRVICNLRWLDLTLRSSSSGSTFSSLSSCC